MIGDQLQPVCAISETRSYNVFCTGELRAVG